MFEPPDLYQLRERGFDPEPPAFASESIHVGGVRTEVVTSPEGPPSRQRLLLYFHGGGYITGRPDQYRGVTVPLAHAIDAMVYVPDYRLAPENPFPSALDDCLDVYRSVVESGVVEASRLALMGDSAGGALVASVLVAARDAGLPLAACGVINSAYADMVGASPSLDDPRRNGGQEARRYVDWIRQTYLEASHANPRDPRHSPVYADLSGLPPLLIQVGGKDNLFDDSVRLAEQARRCGVDTRLSEYPESGHIWVVRGTNPRDPEAERAIEEAGSFILEHVK